MYSAGTPVELSLLALTVLAAVVQTEWPNYRPLMARRSWPFSPSSSLLAAQANIPVRCSLSLLTQRVRILTLQ